MTSSAPAVRIASTIASSSISPHAPSSRLSRSVAASRSGSSETTLIVWRNWPGRGRRARCRRARLRRVGIDEPRRDAGERRLAAAGRAADHHQLAGAHLDVEAVEEATVAVRDLDAVELEAGRGQRDHAAVGDGRGAEGEHLGDAILRAAQVLPGARRARRTRCENWLRPCPIWNAKKNVPTLRLPLLMSQAPAASRPACTSRGIIRR